MKIVCISDTHNQHSLLNIPEADMIIHSGDATGRGRFSEFESFCDWFGSLDIRYKIFVAGNHDFGLDQKTIEGQCSRDNVLNLFLKYNIIYLENESVTIEGIKIYGSPITPTFGQWAFMKNRGGQIKHSWDLILSDTNILITHGPPKDILDECQSMWSDYQDHVGCADLRSKIQTLPFLKLHVFGHIHEKAGYESILINNKNVLFCNASVLDGAYRPYKKSLNVIGYEQDSVAIQESDD
jgi:Icc-related predicted phosphoesterase